MPPPLTHLNNGGLKFLMLIDSSAHQLGTVKKITGAASYYCPYYIAAKKML